MIAEVKEIKNSDVLKSEDTRILDEHEDLQQTNKILKKLKENLSSSNAAERQANLNLILDVINRLMNRIQQRTTTVSPIASSGLLNFFKFR